LGFEAFRTEMRRLRGDTSLRALGRQLPYDVGMLSRVESGRQPPSANLARALDDHFGTGGRFLGLLMGTAPHSLGFDGWEGFEVMRRINASDIGPGQLEQVERAVFELCCDYPYAAADRLRTDTLDLLRLIARIRDRGKLSLSAHRDLLVSAGWAALLLGCVEYDLGLKPQAEADRVAAMSMGRDTGHGELVAWGHEMAAWFGLNRSRWSDVIDQTEGGRAVTETRSVAVQLWAHQARALARMGDTAGVRRALDAGNALLSSLERPSRPEHHFIIDPDKWDFYAMDAYRIVGDNERAAEHATEVIRAGIRPDGTERWPMRMSEARFTLGVIAARQGDLAGSLHHGRAGVRVARKSIPSLAAAARELGRELHERYPTERGAVTDFWAEVAAIAATGGADGAAR
jgi:hypothetical protein